MVYPYSFSSPVASVPASAVFIIVNQLKLFSRSIIIIIILHMVMNLCLNALMC